jgi:hypothetical protein
MTTVTIEIHNSYALKLLKQLERFHIIKLITPKREKDIAKQFAGCISKKTGQSLHEQLTQMRLEWNRSI